MEEFLDQGRNDQFHQPSCSRLTREQQLKRDPIYSCPAEINEAKLLDTLPYSS